MYLWLGDWLENLGDNRGSAESSKITHNKSTCFSDALQRVLSDHNRRDRNGIYISKQIELFRTLVEYDGWEWLDAQDTKIFQLPETCASMWYVISVYNQHANTNASKEVREWCDLKLKHIFRVLSIIGRIANAEGITKIDQSKITDIIYTAAFHDISRFREYAIDPVDGIQKPLLSMKGYSMGNNFSHANESIEDIKKSPFSDKVKNEVLFAIRQHGNISISENNKLYEASLDKEWAFTLAKLLRDADKVDSLWTIGKEGYLPLYLGDFKEGGLSTAIKDELNSWRRISYKNIETASDRIAAYITRLDDINYPSTKAMVANQINFIPKSLKALVQHGASASDIELIQQYIKKRTIE